MKKKVSFFNIAVQVELHHEELSERQLEFAKAKSTEEGKLHLMYSGNGVQVMGAKVIGPNQAALQQAMDAANYDQPKPYLGVVYKKDKLEFWNNHELVRTVHGEDPEINAAEMLGFIVWRGSKPEAHIG